MEDKMERRNFRRADRKRIIVLAFSVHIQSGQPNAMTVYQTCKKMGVRQCTHFQKIMMEMEDEGTLTSVTMRRSDGVWRRVFSLNPDHAEFPKKTPRAIKMNGQLELWS